MNTVKLGTLMAERVVGIDPRRFATEDFELWSIPAFDAGRPEVVIGAEIGSTKKLLTPRDVLLAKIVPHIRRAWVVQKYGGQRQIGSGEWIVFRSPKFHPGYLRHFLTSDEFHAKFMGTVAGVGGSLMRARPEAVKELEVPLPLLEEQRRIAAILDQADMLRGRRRDARASMSRLIDGLFHATFGDPATGGLDWPKEPFDRACLDETSRSDKLPRGDYQREGAYPVVDQGQTAIAGWSDDGDLLCASTSPVIIFGDHTRNVKFVDFPFVIGADGARVLKPTARFNELFFAHLLERMPIPDLGYSRHMREVKRLHFPCPPRALQDRYAEQAAEIARQTQQIDHHAGALDSLFASLQHRAFRGEL